MDNALALAGPWVHYCTDEEVLMDWLGEIVAYVFFLRDGSEGGRVWCER
jgi:hypothetical protein